MANNNLLKKIAPVVLSATVAMTGMPSAAFAAEFSDEEVLLDGSAEDEEADVEFYERNQKKYPEAYVCSQKIVEHIEQHYDCKLSADEKMYLIIYVKRLILETSGQI